MRNAPGVIRRVEGVAKGACGRPRGQRTRIFGVMCGRNNSILDRPGHFKGIWSSPGRKTDAPFTMYVTESFCWSHYALYQGDNTLSANFIILIFVFIFKCSGIH